MATFLGYFETTHSYVKTVLATFWATFGKIGLLFPPTSGHTGHLRKIRQQAMGQKHKERAKPYLTASCFNNLHRLFKNADICVFVAVVG